MNGFLIFLAVALWFGLKVRKAYQKQMSELGGGTPSDEGTVKMPLSRFLMTGRKRNLPTLRPHSHRRWGRLVISVMRRKQRTACLQAGLLVLPIRLFQPSPQTWPALQAMMPREPSISTSVRPLFMILSLIISIFPKYNPLKLINPL